MLHDSRKKPTSLICKKNNISIHTPGSVFSRSNFLFIFFFFSLLGKHIIHLFSRCFFCVYKRSSYLWRLNHQTFGTTQCERIPSMGLPSTCTHSTGHLHREHLHFKKFDGKILDYYYGQQPPSSADHTHFVATVMINGLYT